MTVPFGVIQKHLRFILLTNITPINRIFHENPSKFVLMLHCFFILPEWVRGLRPEKKWLFGCPPIFFFFFFFFLSRCRRADFFSFKRLFFSNQGQIIKLHGIIASISPNRGANMSTLPKNIINISFKPVLKCKQVDNNNLKNIFKRFKFSKKKKKTFLEYWKLGVVYFCTVKTFSSFQKLGAGGGGQPNKFFLALFTITINLLAMLLIEATLYSPGSFQESDIYWRYLHQHFDLMNDSAIYWR